MTNVLADPTPATVVRNDTAVTFESDILEIESDSHRQTPEVLMPISEESSREGVMNMATPQPSQKKQTETGRGKK